MLTQKLGVKNVLRDLYVSDPKNVKSATLEMNGLVLSKVKPTSRGKLEFWKNFHINLHEVPYAHFSITMNLVDEKKQVHTDFEKIDTYNIKHKDLPGAFLKDGSVNIPIFIPSQKNIPPQMKHYNGEYNNILVLQAGSAVLQSVSQA